MLNAHMFLQPQLVPSTEKNPLYITRPMLRWVFGLSAYFEVNKGVTQSLTHTTVSRIGRLVVLFYFFVST